LPVRFSGGEVKSNGELLVAGARGGSFLMTRWLLVAPRGIGRLGVVFFAERAAAGMLPIGGLLIQFGLIFRLEVSRKSRTL
jgi:hypothetical protein